jgi:hypothetical protein
MMRYNNDEGYMRCICGQWAVGYHRDCLALLWRMPVEPDKFLEEEEEIAGDYNKP